MKWFLPVFVVAGLTCADFAHADHLYSSPYPYRTYSYRYVRNPTVMAMIMRYNLIREEQNRIWAEQQAIRQRFEERRALTREMIRSRKSQWQERDDMRQSYVQEQIMLGRTLNLGATHPATRIQP